MDNLTHTLTGILLSRAGLNRLAPRASLILAIGANTPDIDVVTMLAGAETYLEWHRGPTHGLPMAPVMALVPLLAVGLIRRRAGFPWLRAYLLALAGVVSHVALDWTNIYGIRLLAPVSGQWFRLDITSVVDVWIWAVLVVAAVWPLLARLVNAEIGATGGVGAGIARFALVFLAVYDGGRFFLHLRAIETLKAHMYLGRAPVSVTALPAAFNPFSWRGIAEVDGAWVWHSMDLRQEFDPTSGRTIYKAEPAPAIDAARATRAFRVFLAWSQMPVFEQVALADPGAGIEVRATDLRFALPGEDRFQAVATVNPSGRVESARFYFELPGRMPQAR